MTDDIIYGGSIDADRMQYAISATPKPKSQWSVGPDFSIAFCTTAPMPNWLHRTMQRLVLGIYWRKIDNGY